MATQIEIVPVVAFHEGVAAGQKLGRQGLKRALNRTTRVTRSWRTCTPNASIS